MEALVDAMTGLFEAVARMVFWIARRAFGLTESETIPNWARFAAAVVIFGIAALLVMLLWAVIVPFLVVVTVIALAIAFLGS